MARKKISQLESATDVTASDFIQIVDVEDSDMAVSGTNKKATAQLLANELGKLTNVTATGSTTARSLANRFADTVNVKDFGAVGDGVANDTAAIQAAILFVKTNGRGEVHFPTGIYRCNNAIVVDGNFIKITGTGKYSSVIVFYNTTGNAISFTGTSLPMCGIENIGLAQGATSTGNILSTSGVFRFFVKSVFLNGRFAANTVNGLAELSGTSVYVSDCDGVGGESHGIKCISGNDYFIDNTTIQANGVTGSPILVTGVSGGALLVSNSAFLEGQFCFIQNSNYITFVNSYFDSAQGGTQVSGSNHVYFSNCEFANRVTTGSGDGNGLTIGLSTNVVISNSMIINCSNHGIQINSTCSRVTVSGCHIDGNNTANNSAGHGIIVGGGATHFKIIGNTIGNITSGFGGNQKYGVAIGAGASDNYVVKDNILTNNQTSGLIDTPTGNNSIVTNNIGYNPIGIGVVSAPASTSTYTAGHTNETIYLTGGTVSAVKIPNDSGSTVFSSTPCTLHLGPNETFSITYTVAPTMSRYRH